jgi:hypothetical protein
VGQAKLVLWEDIKDNPPPQLKILPIAANPHKSKAFRSIVDLSFSLRLKNGGILESVNKSTVKMAPKGALDQLGQSLSRIIHAFAKAEEDSKIFMAKWDIKDGFWCMDCEQGEEYNFAYVFPRRKMCQSPLSSPLHSKWGGLNLPRIFVLQRRRQGTSRPTTAMLPLAVSPITNLPRMLRGIRNSMNSHAPRKLWVSFMPSKCVCVLVHRLPLSYCEP